ncbi:uncharacterized protein FIBRA_03855 [Fibroporia radiculosa]|uniref:F-box domain-containing protein n=1 Tax=Fibroporia radiculosa TaxID=599839 RepID=J4G6F9_9APHY|nr:uncharacterized protein FIBRA_03855 [Fibroporia radiculosa]CCM01788.1 predicted protein [Fibroporia radiculosa]
MTVRTPAVRFKQYLSSFFSTLRKRKGNGALRDLQDGGELSIGESYVTLGLIEHVIEIEQVSIITEKLSIQIPIIQLPVEIWDIIVDFAVAESRARFEDGQRWLQNYGGVCRAWYLRCRFHARQAISLSNKTTIHTLRLIKMLKGQPEYASGIDAVCIDRNIEVLGPLATYMAQKLPRMATLDVLHCCWRTGEPRTRIFHRMSATFQSMTRLRLFAVVFSSPVILARLVYSFPHLCSLTCVAVTFEALVLVPGPLPSLEGISLQDVRVGARDDVVGLLVHSSLCERVREVTLECISARECQRLVDTAGESLSYLNIWPCRKDTYRKDYRGWDDFPLDITPAVNLHALRVSHFSFSSIHWLAAFLSRASLPQLHEIEANFPFYAVTETQLWQAASGVNDYYFTLIDLLLSGPRYPAIASVTFKLDVASYRRSEVKDVPSEEAWRLCLASRLPRLHRRRRLRTPVVVNVNDEWS